MVVGWGVGARGGWRVVVGSGGMVGGCFVVGGSGRDFHARFLTWFGALWLRFAALGWSGFRVG